MSRRGMMTVAMYGRIKKALQYAKEGVPIKDAFETGHDEQDAVRSAFEFVAAHFPHVHG